MKIRNSILLLSASFLLMVLALYNGFGLVENDTGAYIEMGIRNTIPKDRSVFYGWFIRYTSMWSSLWYTVFAQCLILAYLIIQYTRLIQKDAPSRFILIAVLGIVSFTCVTWVSAYLMPDIFGAILLLAILLLLSPGTTAKGRLALYAVIILAAILVHNSHFLITGICAVALAVWALVQKHRMLLRRSLLLLGISALGWLTLCSVNAGNGYPFTVSRGSHVFMMGKLVETGILNAYLDENCSRKSMKYVAIKTAFLSTHGHSSGTKTARSTAPVAGTAIR